MPFDTLRHSELLMASANSTTGIQVFVKDDMAEILPLDFQTIVCCILCMNLLISTSATHPPLMCCCEGCGLASIWS